MSLAVVDEPAAAAAEPAGFAALLRERTAGVHREAERAGVIADLLRGRATRSGYALFLRNLVPAYAALEGAIAAHGSAAPLGALADPRLHRLPALRRDLAALAGAGWERDLPRLPEADAYAAAIAEATNDPPRLLAHAYARYLGDLSGGQILKPVLARTLGLGADALAFYDFPLLDDPAAAKAAIRATLDAIVPDGHAAATIVEAAIAAFRHNIAVAEAVSAPAHAASR